MTGGPTSKEKVAKMTVEPSKEEIDKQMAKNEYEHSRKMYEMLQLYDKAVGEKKEKIRKEMADAQLKHGAEVDKLLPMKFRSEREAINKIAIQNNKKIDKQIKKMTNAQTLRSYAKKLKDHTQKLAIIQVMQEQNL